MANIQFNSKDAKNFRTVCGKYYNAQHSIASAMAKAKDKIAKYQGIIDDDTEALEAIADGTYKGMKDADYFTNDIADMNQRIADAKADLKDATAKYDKAIADAMALYTKDMHTCASNVVATFGSEDALLAWRKALANSLVEQGVVDATAENVARFDFLVAVRNNSTKKTIENNCLIGIGGQKQSAKLFLNAFVEYLASDSVKAINPFVHKYIPVSLRKKMGQESK